MENKSTIIVEAKAGETYAFCTCKKSSKFPYCDGSHKDSGMTPIIQTPTESINIAICSCGKTGNSIYCDGSHNKEWTE